jgi:hypothetical protein
MARAGNTCERGDDIALALRQRRDLHGIRIARVRRR